MSQSGDRFDLATARLLSAIVDSTTDAIVGKTLEGIVTSWNRGAERIYGYSSEEMIGQSASILYPSGASDDLERILTRLRTGARVDRYTSTRVRKDGVVIDVSLTITPVLDEDGNTVGAATIARDVTEYLKTAEAYRYRVEFEDLVSRISTDFINLAPEETDSGIVNALETIGNFAGVDRSYVFQFSADQATMGNTHEWCAEGISRQGHRLHNAPLSALPEFTSQILRGEVVYVPSTGNLPESASLEVAELRYQGIRSLVLVPMRARDTVVGFLGFDSVQVERNWSDEIIRLLTFVGQIFTNALMRQRAALELQEREIQYRRIFEATSDGLVITDRETGCVLEANLAMCRMHGYPYDEFIGLHRTRFIHPDYHHLLTDYLSTVLAGGEYRVRAVDVRKDGSHLHVEANGAPVIFEGKPAILGVVRDVTSDVHAFELLERRVEQRTQELSTLLEISQTVASTLHLSTLLELIIDQLKRVIEHTTAGILILEDDALVMIGHRNHESGRPAYRIRYPLTDLKDVWDSVRLSRGLIISDVRDDSPEATTFRRMVGYDNEGGPSYIRSCLWAPLVVKGQEIGLLSITSRVLDGFSSRDLMLATAIARQAAIAIDNARLFEQAQGKAALEERQKLARELHDSVSQALYGIALGAKTARTLLGRDPGQAVAPMDYVLSLAEAGLAEMRALIFELRPESLEVEGLVAALTKQTTGLSARYSIDIALDVVDEPDIPIESKEALYRIAQESMHNTIKHARASRIEITLSQLDADITIEVVDNGNGFDTDESFPGHLGLQSMRERAARLGGWLEIDSAPGEGTRILVGIPNPATNRSRSRD
jgi:PAS domain S-box-containing protein